jgi:hypothetical protein
MKFRYIYLIFIIIILTTLYLNINTNNNKEPFIGHLYRPHIRKINTFYETFMNNYGQDRIINQVKKIINY